MVSINAFKKLALSLPEAIELPHFEKTSFRINNKIFTTLDIEKQKAVLMLTKIDQSVFCAFDRTVIYPVDGYWGKQGATYFELKKTRKDMLKDALKCAYNKTVGIPPVSGGK